MAFRRRYHIGWQGWAFSLLSVLIAAIAMNGGHNLLFWVFGVMIASILVSGIVSGGMMGRLNAVRVIASHGVAGQPLMVRYRVVNRSHIFPAFSIHCAEVDRPRGSDGAAGWSLLAEPAEAWVMHVGPRETVHGEAIFRPTRRGVLRFDQLRLATTFPFGLVRKSLTIQQPQHTLVFPRVYALRRHVLDAVAPSGQVGMRITAHSGAGDDFYGLREYRVGDSLRHIAWKRTANRDDLVCIERTRPNPPRLRVVLDLLRPTAELRVDPEEPVNARELEERAISLAASIVDTAERAGFEVGLTVLGAGTMSIPVRRNHWHRNRIMASLAEIDLDAARDGFRQGADTLGVAGESAALVVVHPDRADMTLGRADSWHFTARQLDHLTLDGALDDAPVESESAA